MCIISGPVTSVNSTKILALPSRSGKRQLTVYRNAVITPDSNAMCLPVPNPNSVKFETVPKEIFSQCAKSFEYSRGLTLSATKGSFSANGGALLVQSHGSYEVVLVPSMNDLERVPSHFTVLSSEVKAFLKTSYPTNFGVLLCKLKKGSADYEPFAYSHNIQANTQLFFPTKHYHVQDPSYNGVRHNKEPSWARDFFSSLQDNGQMMELLGGVMPQQVNTQYADDWDHEIYSGQTPTYCHESSAKRVRDTNEINWSKMPNDFNFGPSMVLRCKELVGYGANIDIEMPVSVA